MKKFVPEKKREIDISKFFTGNAREEIWDVFYENEETRDTEFYDRMTDQINGLTASKCDKNVYLNWDDVYDEKKKNIIQGGSFEYIIRPVFGLKWIPKDFKPNNKWNVKRNKWLDFVDIWGRIWEAKSLAQFKNGSINRNLEGARTLFQKIIDISKTPYGEQIEIWVLGLFEEDYKLYKVIMFDLNGILNYLDELITEMENFLEGDIPY